MAERDRKVFRFGVFEADASSGELRKSGVRMKLQEQPFQVLLILLERSGEIVSREELRQKLWPSDTFVDFDHSLNTIINRLREVLGDSAANPRFIETLAKRGYRFLLPTELATSRDGGVANTATPPGAIADAAQQEIRSGSASFLTQPEELPAVRHEYVRILFLLIQIMYLSFYIVTLARLQIAVELLEQGLGRTVWIPATLIVTAAIGIPLRLYLLSAIAFDVKDLGRKFSKLFPAALVLDELWALSPFLLTPQIGLGLALGITAALIYVPFAQRTLVLMRERARTTLGS